MSIEITLGRIEAIVSEIEELDAATACQFRQAEDQEAFYIASRIERKMRRQKHTKSAELAR